MCTKMSDVRLSNASPTLERVDARQLESSLRPSVRRCLFGSPDPEELRTIAEGFRQQEECRFRDTYNFDPVEHRPLAPGPYEWVEWKDAPEFYRRPPHKKGFRTGTTNRAETEPEPERSSSRKRPADPSGSNCSTDPQRKSSRTDGDNEPDPDDETGPMAQVSEQTEDQ